MIWRLNYNVVSSAIRRRCSDVLITTSFYQQYSNVVLTPSLQCRFINNITTSILRHLIDVVFAALLQRQDMVEWLRNVKATVIQCRHDIACLAGKEFRNSRSQTFYKKDKVHRKTMLESVLKSPFVKVVGLKRLHHKYLPMIFCEIFKNTL